MAGVTTRVTLGMTAGVAAGLVVGVIAVMTAVVTAVVAGVTSSFTVRQANHIKTLNTLLDELDNDGNGLIDFGEFRQLLEDDSNQSGALTIDMMVNMFDKAIQLSSEEREEEMSSITRQAPAVSRRYLPLLAVTYRGGDELDDAPGASRVSPLLTVTCCYMPLYSCPEMRQPSMMRQAFCSPQDATFCYVPLLPGVHHDGDAVRTSAQDGRHVRRPGRTAPVGCR